MREDLVRKFAQDSVKQGGSWLFLGAPEDSLYELVFRECAQSLEYAPEAFAQHPDCMILRAPEEKTAAGRSRMLSVEDVRAVKDRMGLASFSGKKFLFFPQASALSDAAQQALLKLIEEPIGDMTVYFFAASEDDLLATLRSRLFTVRCGVSQGPVWNFGEDTHPKHLFSNQVTKRAECLRDMLAVYEKDHEKVLFWIVCVLSEAQNRGDTAMFLRASSVYEGLLRKGNLHAHLARLLLE